MDLAIPVDPVAQADPDRAAPDRAEPRVGTGARADPRRADPGRTDPADLGADTVGSADPADPADRAALVTPAAPRARRAAHGMEIRSVATSTGPRGATDPHLGDRAHHRGLSGAGRSRRPMGNG